MNAIQQIKLDGRPDLNPYAPTSIAYDCWSRTRVIFDQGDSAEAMRVAEDYDRNFNLGLANQVRGWSRP